MGAGHVQGMQSHHKEKATRNWLLMNPEEDALQTGLILLAWHTCEQLQHNQ